MPSLRDKNLIRDLGVVFLSIIVAIFLVRAGTIAQLLTLTSGSLILSSFIAGIFFVSVFTAAPAAVVLVQLAHAGPLFTVAFVASIGAIIGDLLIFRFLEDSLTHDLIEFAKHSKLKKLFYVLRSRPLRWLGAIIGAMIIASPLPDDFGLILLGFTKIKTEIFIPVFFLLNFIGILALSFAFQ